MLCASFETKGGDHSVTIKWNDQGRCCLLGDGSPPSREIVSQEIVPSLDFKLRCRAGLTC